MKTEEYTIIPAEGTLYHNGMISMRDVEVCDHGNTISIGGTEHRKDDLTISEDKIESKLSDWSVSW